MGAGSWSQAIRRVQSDDPFVAIDFEIADFCPDSACAVALVRVDGQGNIELCHSLIRPPRQQFRFSSVHGITWEQVVDQPAFGEIWLRMRSHLDKAAFLAAHNSSFDASVLRACCRAARIELPRQPFLCTVKLARRLWSVYPTTLPDVCAYLGLSLRHHDPCSDAEACAQIVVEARKRLR